MADYTLPNITIRGDVYSIKFVNASVSGLTVPSKCKLESIGNQRAALEGKPNDFSRILPDNMELEFRDTDGFFEALLAGTTDIQILRNNEYLFVGTVLRDIEMPEYYVNGNDSRHNIRLTCVSKIHNLKNISYEDVIAEFSAIFTNYPGFPTEREKIAFSAGYPFRFLESHEFLLPKYIFYAIMTSAFMPGNVVYSAVKKETINNYVSIPNEDIRYHYDSYTYGGINQLLVLYDRFDNTDHDYYIGKKCKTAFDLLILLCKTFCFVPRIEWSSFTYENNTYYHYKLVLQTRRQINRTTTNEPANLISSIKKKMLKPKGIRVFHDNLKSNEKEECFILDGNTAYYEQSPENAVFDIDNEVFWVATQQSNNYEMDELLYYNDLSSSYMKLVAGLSRYDYSTNQWTAVLYNNLANESLYAILECFKYIWRTDKDAYERTYRTITSNKVGDYVTIGSKDFYINSFERNYNEKKEQYELIEY